MTAHRTPRQLLVASTLFTLGAIACGSESTDDPSGTTDSGVPASDAAVPDGDAAAPDGGPPGLKSKLVLPALSGDGDDQFYGVTSDRDGNLFAVGRISTGIDKAGDSSVLVVKLSPDGALDARFGDDGVARHNVAVGGTDGELARAIVLQADGAIVVAGVVEHDVAATGVAASDRDIVLVRFTASGALDKTFGQSGVARLDLGTGFEGTRMNPQSGATEPAWFGSDAFWGLALDASGKLLVHGATRRTPEADETLAEVEDTDFVVVRLDEDGKVDETFGTAGQFRLDLGEKQNANARSVLVLADGSIVAAGYAALKPTNSIQPVIYKLKPDGKALDASFGVKGVFHETVLGAAAEAYSIAPHQNGFVTAGYGEDIEGSEPDMVSIRVDAQGKLDSSYGRSGAFTLDLAGFADRSRAVLALPDGRVLLLGGVSPDETNVDAAAVFLDARGKLDESVDGRGYVSWDLGGAVDMLWGGVSSSDGKTVSVVGVKAAAASSTTEDDDAALLILSLE